MSRRRYEPEGSSFTGKFVTWAIIALIIVLAARNPHQAAAVVHYVASAIATLTSHYGKHA